MDKLDETLLPDANRGVCTLADAELFAILKLRDLADAYEHLTMANTKMHVETKLGQELEGRRLMLYAMWTPTSKVTAPRPDKSKAFKQRKPAQETGGPEITSFFKPKKQAEGKENVPG